MSERYACATCTAKACVKGGPHPEGCPTAGASACIATTVSAARLDAFAVQVMAAAAHTPRHVDGTPRSRVEETIALCHDMGWQCIGVAFCIMFAKEARMLAAMLNEAGFTVVPVCCKVGGVGLTDLGVEMPCPQRGPACNPITQAALMTTQQTEVNIVLGLCVGHDLLFTRASTAPVITLAVKDRALQHQPLAALRPDAVTVK